MIVNKERVKAFINATKEDAQRAIQSGQPSKYSFDSFCRKYNLYKHGKELRSGGVVIECPFHRDDSPSCSMNDELGLFNCFSCGGGNYWKFVHRYHTEVLGEQIGMYQLMNSYLQKDPVLAATLHFTTLYDKTENTIENLESVSKFHFRRGDRIPKTYLELQEKFMRRNPSVDDIKLFILLMQDDVPVDIAWRELMKDRKNGAREKKTYDLSMMDQF